MWSQIFIVISLLLHTIRNFMWGWKIPQPDFTQICHVDQHKIENVSFTLYIATLFTIGNGPIFGYEILLKFS